MTKYMYVYIWIYKHNLWLTFISIKEFRFYNNDENKQ